MGKRNYIKKINEPKNLQTFYFVFLEVFDVSAFLDLLKNWFCGGGNMCSGNRLMVRKNP